MPDESQGSEPPFSAILHNDIDVTKTHFNLKEAFGSLSRRSKSPRNLRDSFGESTDHLPSSSAFNDIACKVADQVLKEPSQSRSKRFARHFFRCFTSSKPASSISSPSPEESSRPLRTTVSQIFETSLITSEGASQMIPYDIPESDSTMSPLFSKLTFNNKSRCDTDMRNKSGIDGSKTVKRRGSNSSSDDTSEFEYRHDSYVEFCHSQGTKTSPTLSKMQPR